MSGINTPIVKNIIFALFLLLVLLQPTVVKAFSLPAPATHADIEVAMTGPVFTGPVFTASLLMVLT